MPVTNYDGRLEAWAGQLEALEQNLEAMYGPPGITPTLPAVTNYDGMLEAIAEETQNAYVNFAKVYGAYHDSVTDVYAMILPNTLLDWFGVKVIGGKTVVFNQLVQNGNFADGTDGWGTYTNTSIAVVDGVLVATSVSSSTATRGIGRTYFPWVVGHKYYAKIVFRRDYDGSDGDFNEMHMRAGGNQTEILATIDTSTVNATYNFEAILSPTIAGNTAFNFTTKGQIGGTTAGQGLFSVFVFMCVDLTLCYGSGNEPSTVAEFTAQFPANYYPYSQGELISAGVTEVVSRKADTTTLATYPIPAEIQALEGYGWSAGSVYNHIDFERKAYVQNVASVDLSKLTWGYGPSVGWSATLNAKNPADDDTVFNGTSATLTPVTRNAQSTAFSGGTDAGMVSVSGGKVYVGTGDIGIVPSGTLYYELDEPVETDISEYLTDTDIEVEAGGSLTFPNQHGDDYRIPVPVKAEYIGV